MANAATEASLLGIERSPPSERRKRSEDRNDAIFTSAAQIYAAHQLSEITMPSTFATPFTHGDYPVIARAIKMLRAETKFFFYFSILANRNTKVW